MVWTHREMLGEDAQRRVIVVTDGDHMALRALRIAAKRTGCRLISRSAGNPTPLTGVEMVSLIRQAPYDPVIVMLDDNGDGYESGGEQALSVLIHHPDVRVIAALAVASNTSSVDGVAIDFSVDAEGRKVETAVDKDGNPLQTYIVRGDTVDILRRVDAPLVVGIGDIGKMHGKDTPERGAPVTTTAIEWILLTTAKFLPQYAHNDSQHLAYGEQRNTRR